MVTVTVFIFFFFFFFVLFEGLSASMKYDDATPVHENRLLERERNAENQLHQRKGTNFGCVQTSG